MGRNAWLSFNANEQFVAHQRPAPAGEAPGVPAPSYGHALAPGYSENLWNARSHVFTFVHAEAEGRNIKVSDLHISNMPRGVTNTRPGTEQAKLAATTSR